MPDQIDLVAEGSPLVVTSKKSRRPSASVSVTESGGVGDALPQSLDRAGDP